MRFSRPGRRKAVIAILGLVLVALAVLATGILVRTARFTSKQIDIEPAAGFIPDEGAAGRLAGAIRFRTIANPDPAMEDLEPFRGLIAYLEETFPAAHEAMEREVIGFSLLYTWPGLEEGIAPILLTSHLDVVPADEEAERAGPPAAEVVQGMAQYLLRPGEDHRPRPVEDDGRRAPGAAPPETWEHRPFEGVIDDRYIWGRGTLDDKLGVVGILEAVERLVVEGFQPRRTILLAFGQDEEVGGHRGAQVMARRLAERGVRPAMVLDEGTPIIPGLLPGLDAPVALVGVAEKGYVSLELVARAEGGHSSSPPRQTAIGILARAMVRIEENPFPARLDGVAERFFEHVGPEMDFARRIPFANLWLFRPLITRRLAANPETSPLVRTSMAVTQIRGGIQDNILPREAVAVVNVRLLPGDTDEKLFLRIRELIDDDRVTVRPLEGSEALNPSGVSPDDGPPYRLVERTIRQVFPEVVVAPFLVTAGTDARFYEGLSDAVYRFLPVTLTFEAVTRIHGINERIAIDDYGSAVQFYHQLIRNADDDL